jgi:hypothetical protein
VATEPRRSETVAGADAAVERALTDALGTRPLDEETLERLRVSVVRNWRAALLDSAIPPVRLWRWAALASAVSAVVITVAFLSRPASEPTIVGSLSRLDAGSVELRLSLFRHRELKVGDPIRSGDAVTAHGPVLVTLARGGTLRVAADTLFEVTGETGINLRRGMVYVDMPLVPATAGQMSVMTSMGIVEHVGTEFEVMCADLAVRIRVREGRIRLLSTSGPVVADAGTEILAARRGSVSQQAVSTYGRDWMWVAALAPDYQIEGRPLIDFLQWVSRELGRHLEFAEARAREVADRTTLHGSVQGHEPLEALAIVLATTSLTYEMRGDTIRVRSNM